MEQATTVGPRLSDADFFSRVDTTRPGLAGIPAAVARGDLDRARHLFAAEVRRTLQPERFLRIRRSFAATTSCGETKVWLRPQNGS